MVGPIASPSVYGMTRIRLSAEPLVGERAHRSSAALVLALGYGSEAPGD